jgi:hypothetical protein
MNYSTRANARHQDIDEKWAAGMRTVTTESAGLLEIRVIDSKQGAALFGAAKAGDGKARGLFGAVSEAANQIRSAPRNRPALCLCCPTAVRTITPSTVFVVASPANAGRTRAVGAVYCAECATDRDTLMTRTAAAFRQIWPELRPVEITHQTGGHA